MIVQLQMLVGMELQIIVILLVKPFQAKLNGKKQRENWRRSSSGYSALSPSASSVWVIPKSTNLYEGENANSLAWKAKPVESAGTS